MKCQQKCYDWLLELLREPLQRLYNIPIYFDRRLNKLNDAYVVIGNQSLKHHYLTNQLIIDCKLNLHVYDSRYKIIQPQKFSDMLVHSIVAKILEFISKVNKTTVPVEDDMIVNHLRCTSLYITYQEDIESFRGDIVLEFVLMNLDTSTMYINQEEKDLPNPLNFDLRERFTKT